MGVKVSLPSAVYWIVQFDMHRVVKLMQKLSSGEQAYSVFKRTDAGVALRFLDRNSQHTSIDENLAGNLYFGHKMLCLCLGHSVLSKLKCSVPL